MYNLVTDAIKEARAAFQPGQQKTEREVAIHKLAERIAKELQGAGAPKEFVEIVAGHAAQAELGLGTISDTDFKRRREKL